ncbi:hypothetical protein [Pantoea phage vB_PdeP_F1M1C]|nr:hypothetical protein [Pantoea phage vB_PdeP_F1M1C]
MCYPVVAVVAVVAVVHRTVLTSCCQPFCFALCAVVRLSHLEDTESVVNVMWCILLRLLHVVNACFSYDLSGCLLIRLTPVSQGVALRPLSR